MDAGAIPDGDPELLAHAMLGVSSMLARTQLARPGHGRPTRSPTRSSTSAGTACWRTARVDAKRSALHRRPQRSATQSRRAWSGPRCRLRMAWLDALLVLDEGEAHVALAAGAEADAGRDGHLGLA